MNKLMKNFLLKISLLMFSFLHYGITIMFLIQGTQILESNMTMFIIMSAISFVVLFLLTMIPLMKSVHEPTSNKQ